MRSKDDPPQVFALWPSDGDLPWPAEAAGHGAIDAVCLTYPWPGNGASALPGRHVGFVAGPAIRSFLVCWTRKRRGHGDDAAEAGSDELIDYKFIHHIVPALRDPRYCRSDGRRLLLVDRPDLMRIPAQATKLWREVAEQAGLGGLLLGAVCANFRDPREFGFDFALACPPASKTQPAEKRTAGCPAVPVIRPIADDKPEISRRVVARALLDAAGRTGAAMVFIDYAGICTDAGSAEPIAPPDRAFLDAVLGARTEMALFLRGDPAGSRDGLTHWLRQIDETRARGRTPLVAVSHDAARAGSQILLLRLLAALKEMDADIDLFVVLLAGGPLRADFAALGAVLDIPETADGDAYSRLIATGLAGRISAALLCNTAVSAPFAAKAAEAGLSTILYLHEMPASIDMYIGSSRFADLVRRVQAIITVSGNARDALARRFPELDGKIEVVRAGIPPDSTAETGAARERDADRLRSLAIDPDRPIVLGCGALHPRKGADLFPLLADAVIGNDKVGYDAQFLWCGGIQGDGEFAAWLDYDARTRGLGKHLRFLGSVPDTGPFYRAAAVFVLPSREDPFPLVALEAAAAGVPIVAFRNAGGACELLDGFDELLVPYGDIEAMARRVGALLKDKGRRDALGTTVRQRAALLCPWRDYVEAMLARLRPLRTV